MANETDIKLFEADGESKGEMSEISIVRNFRTTTTARDKRIYEKRKLNENLTIRKFRTVSVGRCPTLNYFALTERREWHSGLKAQQSLAWGNALRYSKEIAGRFPNDGRYKNAFFNHYVQKSQKILIFLNVLMILHSKTNLL